MIARTMNAIVLMDANMVGTTGKLEDSFAGAGSQAAFFVSGAGWATDSSFVADSFLLELAVVVFAAFGCSASSMSVVPFLEFCAASGAATEWHASSPTKRAVTERAENRIVFIRESSDEFPHEGSPL